MKQVCNTGVWFAMLSLFFAIAYCVPQILSAVKIIPHPQDLFWLFLPSLFLAPAFLVTMVCLHYAVSAENKIWTAIGWSFSVLYAMAVTTVYFTQLVVVLPAQAAGKIDATHALSFEPNTFMVALDGLGYFFMSTSTFFGAFAFSNRDKGLYRAMLFNGLLMPVLILAFFYPVFYYVGALWMITFPAAMIQAVKFFRICAATRNRDGKINPVVPYSELI